MQGCPQSVKVDVEVSSFGKGYSSPTNPGERVSCVWSEHVMSLSEILGEKRLPVIVEMSHDDVVPSCSVTGFSLQQPMLLFREVLIPKVFARNVVCEQRKGQPASFKDVGPYVVVPVDYPGLFRLVEDSEPNDCSVTSVANIARIMPASFLSMTSVKGYVFLKRRNHTIVYEKKDIIPCFFQVHNIHEDYVTYVNSRKKEKRKLMLCLRCAVDGGEKEVLLPYETLGTFYVVDRRKGISKFNIDEDSCLHRITEFVPLLEKNDVTRVKLVTGDPPSQECHFTGLLRLCHVVQEHTVIACTVSSKAPTIFELSVRPHPQFRVAFNTADGQSERVLNDCLVFMKHSFLNFTREMKVRRDYEIEKKDLRENSY
ncbi:uncharacterized protein LOC121375409 [Gigantopelta aegis]|uniref:uncharacterized protein LOC121375409 n=1 Tax=Gigantopelta aegis TaxID=1735272 RepID=UPI001B888239|nr:uncharacterized protein LOC121375409 [Gigantopelta aegis]